MTALLLAALAVAPTVDVHVLTRQHPASLLLHGSRTVHLEVKGESLLADGLAVPAVELPAGAWRVEIPGQLARSYRGALHASAGQGEIALHVRMKLEDYVAAVVASETVPDTPDAALRAQAIVARSYALAARRHADGSACDLTHCQVLQPTGPARHLARARRAASATAGLVLLAGGAVAPAPFHAECAGHTGSAVEVFGGVDRSGSAAVSDPGCGAAWSARLPRPRVDAVLAEVLGDTSARIEDLAGEVGAGGYITRVRDRRTGRVAPGDALVRALDAAAGYGVVRSGHFEWHIEGDDVDVFGRGLGHGVGLCQAGAARLARAGKGEREILARYFPGASIGVNPGPPRRVPPAMEAHHER